MKLRNKIAAGAVTAALAVGSVFGIHAATSDQGRIDTNWPCSACAHVHL